jgi:hypothetical protein
MLGKVLLGTGRRSLSRNRLTAGCLPYRLAVYAGVTAGGRPRAGCSAYPIEPTEHGKALFESNVAAVLDSYETALARLG